MTDILRTTALAMCLGLYLPAAGAAGIFWVVDDAATLDPRSCHVETWGERTGGSTTGLVLAPACADSRGIEWMAAADFHNDALELAGKSVLMARGDHAFALYASTTVVRGEGLDVWIVNAPFTVWPAPEWALHANLGWRHDGRHTIIWGIAADRALDHRFRLIAELYGDQRDDTELQAGLRTLTPSGSVDIALARGLDSGNDWRLTLGAAAVF